MVKIEKCIVSCVYLIRREGTVGYGRMDHQSGSQSNDLCGWNISREDTSMFVMSVIDTGSQEIK